jgi:O-antigen/teichoic acid export membrane protein
MHGEADPALGKIRQDRGTNGASRQVSGDEGEAHKGLSHNATWMLVGRVFNFFFQAAYFTLLARLLEVREYGIFAGAYALVNTITPYSALGAAMLLLRYVSIDPTMAKRYWGNALATTSVFTLLAAIAVLSYAAWTHSIGTPFLVISIILANCLFSQITQLGSSLVFALGNARLSALMTTVSNLGRLVILLVMKLTMGHATASQWSVGLLVASFIAAAPIFLQVRRQIGDVHFDLQLLKQRFGEGLGFSFAGTTEAVNNDLDKVMLANYGMDAQNGFYTLAYRVVDFGTSPIVALTSAVVQRHFVLSTAGVRPVMRLALKSLGVSVVMGIAIGVMIRIGAPLLPLVAGSGFSGAIAVLNILCWLPLIRGVHQSCGSALTGIGKQNWRTAAQAIAALLNVALNLLWIQRFGWRGAAWSTLASDGALAILNVGLFLALPRIVGRNGNYQNQPDPEGV